MKTVNEFSHGDRYKFDFGLCSVSKGFAQVDTGQDAWYFGTWANPEKLQIVCYAEGDVSIQTAETPDEFVDALYKLKEWNNEHGHGFKGIDTMCHDPLTDKFKALGLDSMLH